MANKKQTPPAKKKKPPRERTGPTRQERLEAARASRARKQLLTRWGVPATIIGVLFIFALWTTIGGGSGGADDGPSNAKDVSIDGSAQAKPLAVGATVPNFSAPSLSGEGTVSWNDFKDEPRVLSVWAPWCPHCQKELPVIAKVGENFPGVQIVTVATAVKKGATPTPQGFMTERSLSFPVAIDDAEGTIAKGLGATSFPTVYFVGSDGKVLQALDGEQSEDVWKSAFKAVDATAILPSATPIPKATDKTTDKTSGHAGDNKDATPAASASDAIDPAASPAA